MFGGPTTPPIMPPCTLRSHRGRSLLSFVLITCTASVLAGQAPLRTASSVTLTARSDPNGNTRLLRSPSISGSHVAFAYAGNIWIVERAGGDARRLTSFAGEASNPQLSPDGASVAFSGQYAGNTDVYVVAARGGEPQRLTWHPGSDIVQGWTPDGLAVVFASGRATEAPNASQRFWTVPASGGVAAPMPMPRAFQGKISPDGRYVAYRMPSSWDEERRNYRGGQNKPIWIMDLKSFEVVTTPWKDSKETDPVWSGSAVYFLSDRDGVSNVWRYDMASKARRCVWCFSISTISNRSTTASAIPAATTCW